LHFDAHLPFAEMPRSLAPIKETIMPSRMPNRFSVLCACLSLATAIASIAHANDAKGYTCAFESGTVVAYDNGAFKPEKLNPLNIEIATIDVTAQTATLTGQGGSKAIRVVRAVNALHFLEVASEGFLNVTTIYDRDDAKGANPAVHSRHFGILGQPLVSQYTGFCQPK
jgi:hypothetical protein